MQPYWTNGVSTLYQADARAMPLHDKSVHMVVTSPPYWGLRDYGLGDWEGGDPECDHHKRRNDSTPRVDGGVPANNNHAAEGWPAGICGRCGAKQAVQGIGLEPTLGEWVSNIVKVFRELKRVLRDDGTVWCNLGDRQPSKNLLGMPWKAAFALQDDGWILRSAIVWHKPNPMPESVTDRPTSSYEMIFLLSKGPRYFYDADAVRQPSETVMRGVPTGWGSNSSYRGNEDNRNHRSYEVGHKAEVSGANLRNVWTIPTQGYAGAHFATFPLELPKRCILAGSSERGVCKQCGSPWVRQGPSNNPVMVQKALKSFMDAKGMDRQALALAIGIYPGNIWNWEHGGTPTKTMWNKVCAVLDIGLSWEDFAAQASYPEGKGKVPVKPDSYVKTFPAASKRVAQTLGWSPTCQCNADTQPATILDPFAGSGTTLAVAQKLGRRAIGLDLNLDYLELAKRRIEAIPLPMAMV